jgi:hypothetical protein
MNSDQIIIKVGIRTYGYGSALALNQDLTPREDNLRTAKLNCVKAGNNPLLDDDIMQQQAQYDELKIGVSWANTFSFSGVDYK